MAKHQHLLLDFATGEVMGLALPAEGTPSPAPTPNFTFTAQCPEDVQVQDYVYISGPKVAGVRQVAGVDPRNLDTMPAVGMVTAKADPTHCTVTEIGEVQIAGLIPGKRYMIGLDRRVSLEPPTALDGGVAVMQFVGHALDESTLFTSPNGPTYQLTG